LQGAESLISAASDSEKAFSLWKETCI
jgi:hypothetical protein